MAAKKSLLVIPSIAGHVRWYTGKSGPELASPNREDAIQLGEGEEVRMLDRVPFNRGWMVCPADPELSAW
jgi:hypothetical protein